MSIAAMTEIAFQSRTDVGAPNYFPKTFREIAGAAGGTDAPATEVNTALRTLTNYVPTEIITVYVAWLAALEAGALSRGGGSPRSHWIAFAVFLVVTPVVVWVAYAVKAKSSQKPIPFAPSKWPLWEMVAGAVAFAAWAFALPKAALAAFPPAVAGLVVLLTSTVLGLLAPLFARQLRP